MSQNRSRQEAVSAVVATLEHCQNCSWLSDGVCPAEAAGAAEVGDPDGPLAALAPGATAADEVGVGELTALAFGVVPAGTFVLGTAAVAVDEVAVTLGAATVVVGAAAFDATAAATVGVAVCPGAIALGVVPGCPDGVVPGADSTGVDPGCGAVCAAAG